jgi:stage II sporulation protein AA (anti-sigma F factor antagonist)
MATRGFTFEADRAADTVVVGLAGELDMQAALQLEPALERLTRDSSTRALVVDMNGVEFMDSSGLGLLLALRERLQADDIRLLVANPSVPVRRLLALSGAGDVLPMGEWPPGRPAD